MKELNSKPLVYKHKTSGSDCTYITANEYEFTSGTIKVTLLLLGEVQFDYQCKYYCLFKIDDGQKQSKYAVFSAVMGFDQAKIYAAFYSKLLFSEFLGSLKFDTNVVMIALGLDNTMFAFSKETEARMSYHLFFLTHDEWLNAALVNYIEECAKQLFPLNETHTICPMGLGTYKELSNKSPRPLSYIFNSKQNSHLSMFTEDESEESGIDRHKELSCRMQ